MQHEITGFEQIHFHSDHSILDGYGMVEEYAARAPKINQQFLCITDHGMMAAIPRQIKACDKHHISPIFGCELYVNPMQPEGSKGEDYTGDMNDEEKKRFRKSYHLLAIAYNDIGYKNLVQLSSWGWIKGFYRQPRVNYEQLKKHREGIIFSSACYNSEIGQALNNFGKDAAFDMVRTYKDMFGELFYLEIMLLDFEKQKAYDSFLIEAHDRFNIPLVVTNDCHYCLPEDSEMQSLMLMVQTQKTLAEVEELKQQNQDLFELQDTNLWQKSEEEMNQKWESDYSGIVDYELFKEAKRNTVRICEMAKGVQLDRSIKLPVIEDANRKLMDYIIKGVEWRDYPKTKETKERIKEEYELIVQKEFASYFLLQKMMTDEARRICPQLLGWGDGSEAVGPGRGCLGPHSPVVMGQCGTTKQIKDVVVGDLVVTKNGSVQKVKATYRYPVEEELLNIKCYYGEKEGIVLTKDHKVLAEKAIVTKPLVGNLKWIQAGELTVGDWVFVPTPHCDESNLSDEKGVEFVISQMKERGFTDINLEPNKYTFTTVSRNFADQIRYLCWCAGIPASLGWRVRKKELRPAFENSKIVYSINIPKDVRIGNEDVLKQYYYRSVDGGILLKIRSITIEDKINEVFDLEIENTPSYLTSSFLVHNSGAGSLVLYLLGVTDVDPIKHQLLFSRFLSPARGGKTMKLRFSK